MEKTPEVKEADKAAMEKEKAKDKKARKRAEEEKANEEDRDERMQSWVQMKQHAPVLSRNLAGLSSSQSSTSEAKDGFFNYEKVKSISEGHL